MKRFSLRSALVRMAVLCCVPTALFAGKKEAHNVVPNTVIVRLVPGAVSVGQATAVVGAPEVYAVRQLLDNRHSISANEELRKRMSAVPSVRLAEMIRAEQPLLRTFVLKYAGDEDPYSFAQRLVKTNPNIEIAEPSYVPKLLGAPNDPLFGQQELLEVIRAVEAWDIYAGNETMVIGVSDDGVNQQHEDLVNSLYLNTKEVPDNNIDDDNNGYIDDYNGYNFAAEEDGRPWGDTYNTRQHGVQVAGVLAATPNNNIGLAGVAGKCKIFPLKIAPFGTQSLDYTYESIIYAAVNGFKVLNCSWGLDMYSDVGRSIVEFAISRDLAIVAAGGNDGDSRLVFPAAYTGVLGVADSWPDGSLWSMSAYGAHVSITAPGEGSISTSNSGYVDDFGGTSGAAPVVSAALGIVRAKYPELSGQQAMAFLRRCTDDISALNPQHPGLVPGRVNLLKAVTLNPFDQPGLSLISYALTNASGETLNRFSLGDEINITATLKNYLAASPGVVYKLSVLEDAAGSVQVLSGEQTSTAIASGATVELSGLKIKKVKENPGTVFLRVDIAGDNDYSSYFVIPFRPTLNFAVFSNDSLEVGMTDFGQVGFERRYEYIEDRGFHLRSFGNFLYEGGLMACAGGNRVVSATRSHLWDSFEETTAVDADFSAVKTFTDPNRNTSILHDENAALPVGLEIQQSVRVPSPQSRILAVDVSVKNVSGSVLQDVAAGYFFDWDIGRLGEDNTMDVVFDGVLNSGQQMAWGVASRPGNYAVVGCGVYTSEPGAIRQFAEFDNYNNSAGNPFTTGLGFAQSDKIRSLTSGTTLRYDGSGDVGCVTGMLFPGALQPGETRSFTLLLGAAWTAEQLQQSLDAYWAATDVHDARPVSAALRVLPQPAHDVVDVVGSAASSVVISVVDIFGVPVLSRVATADGGEFRVRMDIRQLPAGVYVVRASDANRQHASVPLVIVK